MTSIGRLLFSRRWRAARTRWCRIHCRGVCPVSAQLDTLRRYVQALGCTLNLEIQLGDETFKIA